MSRRCSNCYWVDWGDVEDLDNDPCEHCRYDPGRYNWRPRDHIELNTTAQNSKPLSAEGNTGLQSEELQ